MQKLIKLLKLKHHVKNIVVFIPLVFSLQFTKIQPVIYTLIAFVSFCLIASAVYVLNDIIDAEKDKLHPIKKNRPIASGKISKSTAWIIFAILTLFSVLCSYTLNLYVIMTVLLYLILNIWYSLQLKYLPIIDVVCIAIGFILRVLAGCFAISVMPSPLVILLTFFTSMFFTFSKRKLEYHLVNDKENCRDSIKEYNAPLLNQYVSINAILAIAFYFTYMLDSNTIEKAQTEFLYITVIPFAIIIFRLLFKIYTCTNNDDPAEFIYKDKALVSLIFAYLLILFAVLIF